MINEPEMDEQGRPIHVTRGRRSNRTLGRDPEQMMMLLRERGVVDIARWTQLYCALLQHVKTEDDIMQARQLADFAYVTAWHVENPAGLAS